MTVLIYLAMFVIAFILGFGATWLVSKLDSDSKITVGNALCWGTFSGFTGPVGIMFVGIIILAILAVVGCNIAEQLYKQYEKPTWWDKKL